MKVVAISDLHGRLPKDLPQGDVLCIAGDICPTYNHTVEYQFKWIKNTWAPWCRALVEHKTFKYVIFVAGNHDWYFEGISHPVLGTEETFNASLPVGVHYLRDSEVTLEGKRFYGTPWQPEFCDWAFNAKSDKLREMFSKIPSGVDVVISHGPPKGYGDTTIYEPLEHLGSWELTGSLKGAEPRYCVFGHIHSGNHTPAVVDGSSTIAANVSLLNEAYKTGDYEPLVFDI